MDKFYEGSLVFIETSEEQIRETCYVKIQEIIKLRNVKVKSMFKEMNEEEA